MQNYPRVLIEPANLQHEKTTLPTDRTDPLLFSLLLCFPGGEATVLFFLDGGGVRAGVSRCDRRGRCSLLLTDTQLCHCWLY